MRTAVPPRADSLDRPIPPIRGHLILECLLSVIVGSWGSSAWAQTPAPVSIVVPSAQTTALGNANNAFPFTPRSVGVTTIRYQQVYDASEFPSGHLYLISQIAFRASRQTHAIRSGHLTSDFATLIWPTLIPKSGPPATLTDPSRSQRDRGGSVGQESPRGAICRDSTGVSVRHRDD